MKRKCLRCGYKWESKKKNPKSCPRCKSYLHNVERREEADTMYKDVQYTSYRLIGS